MVASKKRKSLRDLPVGWQRRRKVKEGLKDANKFVTTRAKGSKKLVSKKLQANYDKPLNPNKSLKKFNELFRKWKKQTNYSAFLAPKKGTKLHKDMKAWMKTQGWEGK